MVMNITIFVCYLREERIIKKGSLNLDRYRIYSDHRQLNDNTRSRVYVRTDTMSENNKGDINTKDKEIQGKTSKLGNRLPDGTIDPECYLKRADEFDHDFLELYMHDPFLGTVSCDITKVADPNFPTAYMALKKTVDGIGAKKNATYELVMGYNPKFFRSMAREERKGVITHELYHLIFGHLFLRSVADPQDQRLFNWATDLAINSLIGESRLPKLCLFPGKRPVDPETNKPIEGPYADFIAGAAKDQASDYYYEELKKIKSERNDPDLQLIFGGSLGTMDDHSVWGEIDPDILEELRDKIQGLVEKATNKADRNNDWGSVPHNIQEMIRKMFSREIDWRSIIRNFIGRSRSVERNSTIKRINKKMPYIHPGCRRPMIANFVCFMDQSGSMSDEDIALLFSELQGLSNLVSIDVYHFDTEVDLKSHRKWKKNDPFPPLRTRCGGTDFQCIADFMNKPENRGKWSGAICLSDGYAPTMGATPSTKVLWVITPTGTMDHIRPGDLTCRMKKDNGQFKKNGY